MKLKSINILIIAALTLVGVASCSSDDDGVERLNWDNDHVSGTWGLDSVLINNAGSDNIGTLTPNEFQQTREGSTVVFDGANMTMTKGGSTVMARAYTVRNFYIKLGTTDLATDTLQLQSLDQSRMNWIKLRQYTDHTHRHYLVYHLNRK